MALSNTDTRYGSITKTFHWLTALLILTLIPLGWYANQLPYDTAEQLARKAWLFSLHKTLGVSAFFVALLRIIWALTQPKPALLHPDRRIESLAAETVHWLLYGALVIVPLSGWIGHAAAAGFAPIWWPFGQTLPLVPKDTGVEHFFAALHWVSTKVLIAALLLHVAGAFKHHLMDRDATLRRMLPGHVALPALHSAGHPRLPLLLALSLWGAAVLLGASLSTSGPPDGTAPVPELAAVASDWEVDQGSIEITVTQFGNEVSGSFADWTAQISFDDTIKDGPLGTVTTTISIPSLALGSVTQQALGADFFDAANHPTAVFEGEITRIVDGYAATGTLRIRETSMPLTLPFNLSLNGDSAEMRSDLTLDRRNFGVGDNIKDEATLAFSVSVSIRLSATRAPDA